MRNGYGENAYNAQAVSELVYEVGVAFHTIYSGESSDALLRNVIRGMIAFFDYNANIQYVQKSSYEYNDSVWYNMMYNEIDNGRPIYYMGYRTIDNSGNKCNIGHAFVLDGYDKDGNPIKTDEDKKEDDQHDDIGNKQDVGYSEEGS